MTEHQNVGDHTGGEGREAEGRTTGDRWDFLRPYLTGEVIADKINITPGGEDVFTVDVLERGQSQWSSWVVESDQARHIDGPPAARSGSSKEEG